MEQCKNCGDFIFVSFGGESQKCACQQFTIVDEDGEEHSIYAIGQKEAALKYAEKSNSENDYYLMNETVDILVNGEAFRIGAEPDVCYSAKAL